MKKKQQHDLFVTSSSINSYPAINLKCESFILNRRPWNYSFFRTNIGSSLLRGPLLCPVNKYSTHDFDFIYAAKSSAFRISAVCTSLDCNIVFSL
jgi:hypothetical protein